MYDTRECISTYASIPRVWNAQRLFLLWRVWESIQPNILRERGLSVQIVTVLLSRLLPMPHIGKASTEKGTCALLMGLGLDRQHSETTMLKSVGNTVHCSVIGSRLDSHNCTRLYRSDLFLKCSLFLRKRFVLNSIIAISNRDVSWFVPLATYLFVCVDLNDITCAFRSMVSFIWKLYHAFVVLKAIT